MRSKRRSEESETSRRNNRGRKGNPRRKNKRRTREEETSRKNNRLPRGGETQGGGGWGLQLVFVRICIMLSEYHIVIT